MPRTEIDTEAMYRPFALGPAWQARHRHPVTSMSVKDAAAALINAHGAEKAEAWCRALLDNLRIDATRDRAQSARDAADC